MPGKNKAKPTKVHYDNTLPVIFVDAIATAPRKDGLFFLTLGTQLPDSIVEQVRLITDAQSLHMMIDHLCDTTEYFPEQPAKKKRRPSDQL